MNRAVKNKFFFRKFHETLELDPQLLTLSLSDPNLTPDGPFFNNNQLSNLNLYKIFVREIGNTLANITNPANGEGSFIAQNGVHIRVDFNVCDSPDCFEDYEGQQKVRR